MIAGLLALCASLAPGVDDRPGDRYELQRVAALTRQAHRFLAEQQNPDGSFSIVRNTASASAPVAVTALATLSFLASGHLPGRGPHGRLVERASDWLVDRCGDDGYFYYDGDTVSKMHGQGYALLALSQAYGTLRADAASRQRMRAAIQRAVRLIESTQGQRGGWWYDPRLMTDHEGSVTVCLVQALRAARDAGFQVDTTVVDRALRYMADSQDPASGQFRYRINSDQMSWALTAAALSTLNALGDYGSDRMEHGFEALMREDPFGGRGKVEPFRDYGALYAAQAYWQHADRRGFDRWWPQFVEDCAERQRPDGSFFNGRYGSVYATAVVSLTLQVPVGYLPIFQN